MLTAIQLSKEMVYDHVIVRLFSAVFITTIAEFTIKDKLDQLKCLTFFCKKWSENFTFHSISSEDGTILPDFFNFLQGCSTVW